MKALFTTIAVLATAGMAIASQEGGREAHQSPWPFIFQVINFFLFLIVLYKFALPRIKNFFFERSQKIRQDLKEAEGAKALAEKRLKEYEQKLASLEKEVDEIRRLMQKEGQAERERIIKEAEREAELIKNQARIIAEQEIKRAKQELKKEVIKLSLGRAGKLIKETINEKDQARLITDYIKHITVSHVE